MSASDSDSNRSPSPSGPVPTPGYGLDKSRSNSPDFDAKTNGSRDGASRSRSNSPASNKSGESNRSIGVASNRSGSAASNKSAKSNASGSVHSSRSGSRASNRSRSRSSGSHRSKSVASNRSGSRSANSNRSRSADSNHSGSHRSRSKSAESHHSGSHKSVTSNRSRSRSVASNRSVGSNRSKSKSVGSNRSRSRSKSVDSIRSRSRSKSVASNRSRSRSGSNRSRSRSAGSNRSRSKSADSNRSGSKSPATNRSRSKSAESNRSRSKSPGSKKSKSGSPASNKSRSRSNSVQSNRSRSKSPASNRSRSLSQASNRSRSRSNESHHSKTASDRAPNRSGSNSPNLEIDEDAVGEKRKRDSSPEKEIKKKSKIIDTDSEPEDVVPDKGASAAQLFGDADDISSEEDKEESRSRHGEEADDEYTRRRSDDEDMGQQAVPEKEPEPEPEPIPETRIDVRIPKITCDLGREIHFVKLPNFLSVETRPFDQETYEDEIDEEETLDEEGRARLKLKVENTIRWRDDLDKEGNVIKQSNARMVRWSDGSLSLHLGSEIFDVYKQPLQGDHNHLFIRQGTGLQGQAVFRTKLSFRPHSTESFTHRKMTLSLADRSQKTPGIKILSQVGIDPDQDRKTLLKKEEEKLRQTVRVFKPRKRSDGGARVHIGGNTYREEDGSDEDGAISLNAIKNKYKPGTNRGGAIYSSDEEGSDFETRRGRKTDKPKALKDSEESSEENEIRFDE